MNKNRKHIIEGKNTPQSPRLTISGSKIVHKNYEPPNPLYNSTHNPMQEICSYKNIDKK
jgi:hypothetical protein